jgi:hypothetical protein
VLRIILAGVMGFVLTATLVTGWAWADEAAAVATQAAAIPESAPSSGSFKPPPRGAPANRVGAGSRDLSGQRRVALVVGNGAYQHLPVSKILSGTRS